MSPAVTERIFQCWKRGAGVGETVRVVLRLEGERLDVGTVRREFAALSHRYG